MSASEIVHCHWIGYREPNKHIFHYNDAIMGAMASEITSFAITYSTVYSGADQRKHQSCASLAFVQGIHRWPMNSLHKGPVTRKMFPFDDVIMLCLGGFNNLVSYYGWRCPCARKIIWCEDLLIVASWPNNWLKICVKIGSSNELLPDGTKLLLESMFIFDRWVSKKFTGLLFQMKCSRHH